MQGFSSAAFGIPQLIFFGPSDEELWHPWSTRHRILKSNPIDRISVAQAASAVEDLLQ
jgi:ADP-heptose:LPS heptosyltransferase